MPEWILAIAGAALLSFGVRGLVRAYASSQWPTTVGKITSSFLDTSADADIARIRYEYTVNGATFTGDRIAYGDFLTNTSSRARYVVRKYPEEMAVTVHYMVDNPDESLLDTGIKLRALFMPGVGLILIALSVILRITLFNETAEKRILDLQREAHSGHNEFRGASPEEFPHINVRYYDQMQRRLERIGFATLGDIESRRASRVIPNMRTFIRAFLDGDGTMASVYDIKIRGWMRILQLIRLLPTNLKAVVLESELSDGSFVVTANCLHTDSSGEVPGIKRTRLPRETPVEESLAIHKATVKEVIGNLEVRRQRFSLSGFVEAQDRCQELINREWRSTGYMDGTENPG